MRSQRLRFPDGSYSFTVVDGQGLPVSHVEDYLHFLRQTASPNTVRAYSRALGRWFTHLGAVAQPWDDFPTTTFGDFLLWLRTGVPPHVSSLIEPPGWLAPASVDQHAAAILAFYTYQADAHGLHVPFDRLHTRSTSRRSPYQRFFTGITAPKKNGLAYRGKTHGGGRHPVLSPTQVHTILDACARTCRHPLTAARDQLMISTLWETGMRVGELLGLQHRDFSTGRGDSPWVDVLARHTHPHGARGKTPRHRRIYISDDLEAAYAQYLWQLIDAGIDLDITDLSAHHVFVNVAREPVWSPIRVETVYQKVTAIKRWRPELPRFTPHWFRHTHATTLLLAGAPPHVVMRRLGHADVQTTLSVYGWVTEDAQMRTLAGWKELTATWRGLE